MFELLLAFLFYNAANAPPLSECDCKPQDDVAQARKHADAIVVANAIKSEEVQITNPRVLTHFPVYVMRYTFFVERRFKGRIPGDSLVVYTGNGNDCGSVFEIGGRYILYGENNRPYKGHWFADEPLVGRGIIWTDVCMRTRPYDEAEIKELERRK